MRVLIACEFSGVVRDAFAAAGHDAWSCDLLPSERGGKHLQGDVFGKVFGACAKNHWDLMIAHPPCTYLCNSGVRWLFGGKGTKRDTERWALMEKAAEFFYRLLTAPIPRICVENPIMHRYALEHIGKLNRSSAKGVKYSQTIQPWEFGHPETKCTALWLVGLPPLKSTNVVAGRTARVHRASPGPDRWKERSRTLPGIAAAMAEQWGIL